MVTFQRSDEHFRIVERRERTAVQNGDQLTITRTFMLFVSGTTLVVCMSLRPDTGVPISLIETLAEIFYFVSLVGTTYVTGNILAVLCMSLHYKHWSSRDKVRLVTTAMCSTMVFILITIGYYTLKEIDHDEIQWSIVLAVMHFLATTPPLVLGMVTIKNNPEKYLIHS